MTDRHPIAAAERALVLHGLARLALIAALASNATKAQAVFAAMSAPADAFSPWALAIGLELALGVASYALAERLQRNGATERKQPAAALWLVTVVFAAISVAANVVYFSTNGGTIWLAVAFGIAAPAVALANAALTGDVAGAAKARDDAQAEAQHALERRRLDAEVARHAASGKRADARRAKAEAQGAQQEPQTAQAVQAVQWAPDDLDDIDRAILDGYRDRPGASYSKLAGALPVGRSTIGVRVQKLEAGGYLQRGPDGSVVVLYDNGHGPDDATL